MKRPSPTIMVVGHPLVGFPIVLAACFITYLWYIGDGDGSVAFVMLLLAAYAVQASKDRRAHLLWKQDWDTMGGIAPRRKRLQPGALRVPLLLAIWGLFAWWAIREADDPSMQIPLLLFWLASAGATLALIWRRIRRRSTRRRHETVQLCLRVPRQSDSAAQAREALPDYCRQLMR